MMRAQNRRSSNSDSVSLTTPALMGHIVHGMMLPQGFTLSVAGTLATMICQRSDISPCAIWLFVVGAGCSYGLINLTSKPGGEPTARNPVGGFRLVNLTPILVVPIATRSAGLIHCTPAAFACAGFVVVTVYVGALANLLRVTCRSWRAAETKPSDRSL